MANPLIKIGEQKSIVPMTWPYENEPTHLPKSDYVLRYMPITGIPYWEEGERLFRGRMMKEISQ